MLHSYLSFDSLRLPLVAIPDPVCLCNKKVYSWTKSARIPGRIINFLIRTLLRPRAFDQLKAGMSGLPMHILLTAHLFYYGVSIRMAQGGQTHNLLYQSAG